MNGGCSGFARYALNGVIRTLGGGVLASLVFGFQNATAAVPVIEDAPLDDAIQSPLIATGEAEWRFTRLNERYQTRVYTITSVEYAHVASYASPMFVANGLARSRSAHQELNGEWLYHPSVAWTIKADGQLQYSTAYEQATALYPKGAQDWAKVNELFFETRFGGHWSLLGGKYRRVFGPGIFQNPMDAHNPLPAMPGSPLQREGAWLAQIAWEPGWINVWARDYKFSAALLPRYFVDKNGWPAEDLAAIDYDPTRFQNGGFARTERQWSAARAVILTRIYSNVLGGDANLVNYHADELDRFGVSYQRYVHSMLELHVEALYTLATESKTDASKHVNGLAGVRFEYDTDRGVIVEYLYQGGQPRRFPTDTAAQRELMAHTLNPENQISPNTPLREYLMISGYVRNIRDRASVTLNTIVGLAQSDAVVSLRADLKVGGVASLAATASHNLGGVGSYFGSVVPNDWRVGSEIQVVF